MVITPETIDAVIRVPSAAVRPQSGVGRVVITDKATWLQTAGERIPIELPEGNNLSNGCTVRYEISGNTISITPNIPQKNIELPITADTFNPQRSAAGVVAPVAATGPFSAGAIVPGLYLFNDIDEAAAVIGRDNDELLRQLRTLIAEDGAAALRVETAGTAATRIFLLKIPEITLSLQSLRASFSSAGLASIPVDVLQQVLLDRGSLPFLPLMELDEALPTGNIPFTSARAGSVDAQKSALVQWLHAVLSNEKLPVQTAPLAPAAPASAVMSTLEQLFPAITATSGKQLPGPGTFGLTRQSIGPTAGGDDEPIIAASMRMGFTMENSLGNVAAEATSILPGKTLKGLLLQLLSPSTMPTGAPFKAATDSAQTASSAPGNATSATATAIYKPVLPEQLGSLYRDLLQTIRREAPLLFERLNAPVTDDLPPHTASKQPTTAAAPAELGSPPFIKSIADRIAEMVSIARTVATQPATVLTGLAQHTAAPTPALEIAVVLRQLTEIADLLTRTAADAEQSTLPARIVPLIGTALSSIETLIEKLRGIAAPETDSLQQSGNERTRAAIGQPPEHPQPTIPATNQQSLFGKTIETALDRLESLQLLARQTSTVQGTQQIIALPIKFGEAWTEVNIRLLHHRQRKSSKSNPHYSVFLDVAPAALGAISAHLDYRTSAPLKVCLEFERPSTRNWFTAHRDELQSSLLRGGTTSVHLDFRQKHKESLAPTTVPRNDSGTIDMTG